MGLKEFIYIYIFEIKTLISNIFKLREAYNNGKADSKTIGLCPQFCLNNLNCGVHLIDLIIQIRQDLSTSAEATPINLNVTLPDPKALFLPSFKQRTDCHTTTTLWMQLLFCSQHQSQLHHTFLEDLNYVFEPIALKHTTVKSSLEKHINSYPCWRIRLAISFCISILV